MKRLEHLVNVVYEKKGRTAFEICDHKTNSVFLPSIYLKASGDSYLVFNYKNIM